MKRLLSLLLAVLALATLAPASAHAANAPLTAGFLPVSTGEASIIVRGAAPRGQVVSIAVNGAEQVRVVAFATMDVYHVEVALVPGLNQLTVTLEGTDRTLTRTIVRTTASFGDLAGHWAQQDIEVLATLGVVNGMGNGAFGPDNQLTRAQFAKLVVLGMGLTTDPAGPAPAFTDADAIPAWGREYVAAAVAAGLIKGYDDGSFQPDAPVTRAEMAVIAARGLRKLGIQPDQDRKPVSFTDQADIPAWAQADVELDTRNGVIESYWGEAFRPGQKGTRAEAAALIRRLWSVRQSTQV